MLDNKCSLFYLVFCPFRLSTFNADHLIEVADRRRYEAVGNRIAVVFTQHAFFVVTVVTETFALKSKSSAVISAQLFTVI